MNLILFALTVGPSLFLLIRTKNRNNYTEHPRAFIIKLLVFGALTVIPVYIFETLTDEMIYIVSDTEGTYNFLSAFIGTALIEEFFKLIVLYELTEKYDRYLRTVYDSIIYSVAVAMGFAILEDITYVYIYYGGSFSTAIIRAVTPGHFCFSIFMGFLFAEAKKYEHSDNRKYNRNLAIALLVPTLIHGFYDYCLFEDDPFLGLVFVVFLVVLFIVTAKTLKKRSQEIYFI